MVTQTGPVSRAWAWVRRPWTLTADCRHSLHTLTISITKHYCPFHDNSIFEVEETKDNNFTKETKAGCWGFQSCHIGTFISFHALTFRRFKLQTVFIPSTLMISSLSTTSFIDIFMNLFFHIFINIFLDNFINNFYTIKPSTSAASICVVLRSVGFGNI